MSSISKTLDRECVELDPPPVGVVSVHVQLERVPRALGQAAGGAVVGRRPGPVDVLRTILQQSNMIEVTSISCSEANTIGMPPGK